MRKRFIITILLFSFSFACFGQDSIQLKRIPFKLVIAVDKKSTYEEEIKATPYVLSDKTIQIYPGETIYVEVETDDGNIKTMTAVKEIRDAKKTLTIKFTQTTKKNVHESMMLTIVNPFSQRLIYSAKMFFTQSR